MPVTPTLMDLKNTAMRTNMPNKGKLYLVIKFCNEISSGVFFSGVREKH